VPDITLSQGTITYEDEGSGPPVVFVHGFLVDGDLWRETAAQLRGRARCIRPTLPLGAHRRAMGAAFDASPRGVARLLLEFLDALGLEDVTLVGNDTGGAICQFAIDERPDRVARLVLTNCDAFERFPPPPYNGLTLLPRIPGAVALTALTLRVGPLQRPAFVPLSKKGIPAAQLAAWHRPFTRDKAVRAETARFLRAVDPGDLLDVAARLRRFGGPVRIVWGTADRFFRLADARRLAAAFRDAELVEVPGARTFVPWDEPGRLADEIAGLLAAAPTRPAAALAGSSPSSG